MKRILSLLLILSFLLTALLACGNDEPEETEKPTEASGEQDNTDDGTKKPQLTKEETDRYGQNELVSAVPVDELDFGGETLTILVRNDDKIKQEFGKDTVSDEDGIDEAVATRNEQVALALGLEVTQVHKASQDAGECSSVFADLISTDVINGEHNYDIAANFGYYACAENVRTNSANLLDKDIFAYFNFDLPCWNQSIANGSKINGKSYVCAGDLTFSIFDFSMIFWQNVDLYNELKEDGIDPDDMSQYTLDGNWVAEDLFKWSQVYVDSNTQNDCDTYGISLSGGAWCTQPNDAIPFAWDLDLMTTDNDGRHHYNLDNNSKAEEAIPYFRSIWDSKGNSFHHTGDGGATIQGTCVSEKGCFHEGHIVFNGGTIRWGEQSTIALRSVDFEYALLPWPKWDTEQENYATTAQDCYTLLTVLNHYDNASFPLKADEVSAYLQLSTELSYTDVRGFYFEEVVKSKLLGTGSKAEASQKIFDQIVDELQFEFYALYSNAMGNVMHLFRYAIRDEQTLKARYEANKETVDQNLAKVEAWFWDEEIPE